ncbi:hypothetical protein THAOC_10070 [Thalassiosira oceanica]|uniref:RING-type domain-containing protein n=1 Tax=Thalassiosira oceanica TaxID=159749 RepID=K0TDY0_THAOC|nr:hypothetical protein THAOC_10070 [Thalassiosira oceanica]|eukprot:EJK68727.1 hypothetical protein THAOC_10070 [Thalassiosira oceanica]
MERQRIARSGNADFTNRRFSNGYLRPAESQVNYKYVQMDVEALNDGHQGGLREDKGNPEQRINSDVKTTMISAVNFASASTRICGACEQELPEGAYSREQWARRQTIRRCKECVDAGNQLVLMKKGRTRSEEDDCPICSLPLPLDGKQSMFMTCCMTLVCNGCIVAAEKRGMDLCPFCRAPKPKMSQTVSMIEKRVDAGDPVAICCRGSQYADGSLGLTKDVTRAIDLYERAAELGLKDAHCSLGNLYNEGTDVEKDPAKAIRHWEAAAVKGDARARHNLGVAEYEVGNYDLALQHFMIAAKLGDQDSLNNVKTFFMNGLATKSDYAEALRGHQSAVEEMRSPDREEALALRMKGSLYGSLRSCGTRDDQHEAKEDPESIRGRTGWEPWEPAPEDLPSSACSSPFRAFDVALYASTVPDKKAPTGAVGRIDFSAFPLDLAGGAGERPPRTRVGRRPRRRGNGVLAAPVAQQWTEAVPDDLVGEAAPDQPPGLCGASGLAPPGPGRTGRPVPSRGTCGVPEEASAASRAPCVGREPKWGGLRRGRAGTVALAVCSRLPVGAVGRWPLAVVSGSWSAGGEGVRAAGHVSQQAAEEGAGGSDATGIVRVTGHRKLGRRDDDDIRIQFRVGVNPDLRRVRTRTAGWLVQQGTVGTQAEHPEMRRVRRHGESAGADEEGPLERLTFMVCCAKLVCNGCIVAAEKRGMDLCPFCRAPTPDASQLLAMVQKRVDAGDPMAMWSLGTHYGCDEGNVEKDPAKAILHWEAAAVKGDAIARHNLGIEEDEAGNNDIALQHYMIAAKLGCQVSLNNIKTFFINGLATKSDYAEALRGHQSAVEEMRSPDREEALALG